MKKTKGITKYVLLMEKKNGKIVKNEQYTIQEFMKEISKGLNIVNEAKVKLPNRFWIFFKYKKFKTLLKQKINKLLTNTITNVMNSTYENVEINIHRLIAKDMKGKIRRKTK